MHATTSRVHFHVQKRDGTFARRTPVCTRHVQPQTGKTSGLKLASGSGSRSLDAVGITTVLDTAVAERDLVQRDQPLQGAVCVQVCLHMQGGEGERHQRQRDPLARTGLDQETPGICFTITLIKFALSKALLNKSLPVRRLSKPTHSSCIVVARRSS